VRAPEYTRETVKRRDSQERDEADARAQAESRREKLLAELKAREAAGRETLAPPSADASLPEPEPDASESDPPAPEPDADGSPEEPAG
jgi:hypothetical protein